MQVAADMESDLIEFYCIYMYSTIYMPVVYEW